MMAAPAAAGWAALPVTPVAPVQVPRSHLIGTAALREINKAWATDLLQTTLVQALAQLDAAGFGAVGAPASKSTPLGRPKVGACRLLRQPVADKAGMAFSVSAVMWVEGDQLGAKPLHWRVQLAMNSVAGGFLLNEVMMTGVLDEALGAPQEILMQLPEAVAMLLGADSQALLAAAAQAYAQRVLDALTP